MINNRYFFDSNDLAKIKLSDPNKRELLDVIGNNIRRLMYIENLIYRSDNNEISQGEIENLTYELEYLIFKLKANSKSYKNKMGGNLNE